MQLPNAPLFGEANSCGKGRSPKHQVPRLLGRKVHAHDLGIEGLGQKVGRLFRRVGEA